MIYETWFLDSYEAFKAKTTIIIGGGKAFSRAPLSTPFELHWRGIRSFAALLGAFAALLGALAGTPQCVIHRIHLEISFHKNVNPQIGRIDFGATVKDMTSRTTNILVRTRDHDFVMSLADLEQLGISRWAANRRVISGEWQRLAHGIYLTHALNPSWRSRARVALLIAGKEAFLTHESAWFLHGLTQSPPRVITVGVPGKRRINPRPGIRFTRRSSGLLIAGSPRATIPEETVLDLGEQESDVSNIIGVLTHGFRNGLSHRKLMYVLERRSNYARRDLFLKLLNQVQEGVESPLEYSYDTDVEGAHGLPRSRRQQTERISTFRIRADRIFDLYQLRVELDGYLGHPGGPTDRDMWRDNAVLIARGDRTLRYRWANILGRPCETAGQISAALRQGGWDGQPKKCGPECTVLDYRV